VINIADNNNNKEIMMKKLLSLFVLMAGVVAFTSCGEDDATYNAIVPLEIKSADVLFDADGGQGTIVVNTSSALQASCESSWAKVQVNGSSVSVTAEKNPTSETRSAKIILTADGKTASVVATQKGVVIGIKGSSEFVFTSDNAASFNVDFAHTYPLSNYNITVQSLSDWITAEYNAETGQIEAKITANTGKMIRRGYVQVKMDDHEEILSVIQYELENDILGDYNFCYLDNKNTPRSLPAQLTENALTIRFNANATFTIPVNLTKGNPGEVNISIESGSFLGTVSRYNLYMIFLATSYWSVYYDGYWSSATISLVENADGSASQIGKFGGYIYEQQITTWLIRAFSEKNFSANYDLGTYTTFTNPYIVKASAAQ